MAPFLDPRAWRRNRLYLLGGVIGAILLAMSLAVFKLVVLKMLPFDNKSEFQVVVNMPVGTPLEQTARVLREHGRSTLQTVPEVTDYQAYAGTASPINFNGLVRQYYLRESPELGDIQVNLVDKHHRDRKQPRDRRFGARRSWTSIGKTVRRGRDGRGSAARVRRCFRPIVAEIYGPDYDGQMRVAKQVRAQFAATPDIVGITDTVDANAPRLVLRVLQNKAALSGVAQKDMVETMRMGLSGEYVTPIHSGEAKYEIPVRLDASAGTPERRRRTAEAHGAQPRRASWCRCRSWCRW